MFETDLFPPVERKTLGLTRGSLGPKYPTYPILGVHIGLQSLHLSWSSLWVSLLDPKTNAQRITYMTWLYHSTVMKCATTRRIDAGINSRLSVASAALTAFSDDSFQSFELFFSNKHWVCDSISLRSPDWHSALLIWVSWFFYKFWEKVFAILAIIMNK